MSQNKPHPKKLWCRKCRIHPDKGYSANGESAYVHCGICKHPLYDPIKPSRIPFWVCVSVVQGVMVFYGIIGSNEFMIKSEYEGLLGLWILVSVGMIGVLLIAVLFFVIAIIPREKASAEWLSWALENGYKEDIN